MGSDLNIRDRQRQNGSIRKRGMILACHYARKDATRACPRGFPELHLHFIETEFVTILVTHIGAIEHRITLAGFTLVRST